METKIFEITSEENLLVERLNYIFESHKALCSVLAREFANSENSDAKEMLIDEKEKFQRAYIELRVAQDAILDKYLGSNRLDMIHFKFDFVQQEVICW